MDLTRDVTSCGDLRFRSGGAYFKNMHVNCRGAQIVNETQTHGAGVNQLSITAGDFMEELRFIMKIPA